MKLTVKKPNFYAQVKFDSFTENWLYKENTPDKMVQRFTNQEEALSFMKWRQEYISKELKAQKILEELKDVINILMTKYDRLAKRKLNDNNNEKQYGWYLGKIDILENLANFINGKEL